MNFPQFRINSHFFLESSVRRVQSIFARTRMRATSVGPQAAGVVFFFRSSLQKQFPNGVKNKNRKTSVQ